MRTRGGKEALLHRGHVKGLEKLRYLATRISMFVTELIIDLSNADHALLWAEGLAERFKDAW